jgi:tetratricopeptide (TPR) repeat protein
MNTIELIGFRATVLDLLGSDKRQAAFDLLDHFFDKARTLEEFDVLGELALKTEYRDLHLKCAETAHSVAITSEQKRSSRSNLINAYNAMNYPEKALFYIDLQLKQTPDDFNALCQKAANISLMGDKDTAENMIQNLRQKYPEKEIDLHSMLSGKYLREGQLTKGIMAFVEAYKPKHKLFEEQLQMKRWDGIARPGRTVYVDGEGGIGDEIINIRFFKNIQDMGMRPILCSPNTKYYKDKNNLFRRHGIEILSESFSIDRKQFWVPMMSLPAALNLTEADLWKGTYLIPPKNKKIESKKFKIGIKCSGNPFFAQDEYRKIPMELMLSYLPEEAELYYIDKLKVNHPRITDLADEINSWDDTLDLIDSMDCIVSSCTSLVHAAGAIGKTTFVAVPIAEYYIWTTSRRDNSSPWYGENFHVMKQKEVRDWNKPLSEIETKVRYMMEKHRE